MIPTPSDDEMAKAVEDSARWWREHEHIPNTPAGPGIDDYRDKDGKFVEHETTYGYPYAYETDDGEEDICPACASARDDIRDVTIHMAAYTCSVCARRIR